MDNKLTIVDTLKLLVNEHKQKSLQLMISPFSKRLTSLHCDLILKMIDELKEAEKEQSRIYWKAGYIECTINWGEFFGNEREDSFPNVDELNVIDILSHKFV